ncbi:DUF6691 family protein [Pseudoduganella sp. UC29_106]|uniref:DUF6691 family protein n=1 Tax=Pseudoduganella sp. UC29_106 TaxID=3374553 RepID=UPI0037571A3B
MQTLIALICGLVFGIGLILSGMTDPAKVTAFLDLAGDWDPSLAFVMLGAVAAAAPGFALAKRRRASVLGTPVQLPASTKIDRRLLIGSLAFGVGWGLAGYCPGPAINSLGRGSSAALIFTVSMLIGMAVFEGLERYRATRRPATITQ